jgi:putative transposase
MTKQRRQFSAKFKFQVALEALKELKTINEIASQYEVHPTQVKQWKKQLQEGGTDIFGERDQKAAQVQADVEANLYEQIGRLKMELEWVKKKLPESRPERCALIEPEHPDLSVRRQCELLGVNRSTLYYVPATESPLNLELMQLIDKQYMRTPFYGWPRMTVYVRKQGYLVNHKRIQRLMQKMGIQAIYPKPSLSKGHPGHKIYPYLLRDVAITRQNQVWSTDITYIPLRNGFMYLVAVIDWYSRYVLAWQLSNTLESTFCIEVLQQALQQGCPEIFNTDQGSQFTSLAFTAILQEAGIQISMDGRGRALDNIFIARLWRSVKYEDIYLYRYETVPALIVGLERYFAFYNQERPHQSLDYQTPAAVYADQTDSCF